MLEFDGKEFGRHEYEPMGEGPRRGVLLVRWLFFAAIIAGAFTLGLRFRESGRGSGRAPADQQLPERTPEESRAPAPIFAATVSSTGAVAAAAPAPDLLSFTPDERRTIELFRDVSPSVVFITTVVQRVDFFSRQAFEAPAGSGSGFVWDRDGHIVTNYHVVSDNRGNLLDARVTLADQSVWEAEVRGGAIDKDLAVLRIKAPAAKLRPIRIGSSAELLVGQTTYAIGNPFGLDQTLTTGVISALGREIESLVRVVIRDVIQTDAAINPGNSGGPLLDSSGRLIGVNTQIYSTSGASAGIGFAIPVDTVSWVVADLIEFGEIRRPQLGVETAPDYVLERTGIEGALILSVGSGSAAEAAGLRPTTRQRSGDVALGDIIVAVDGKPVRTGGELRGRLLSYQVGDSIELTVLRERKELKVTARLQAMRAGR